MTQITIRQDNVTLRLTATGIVGRGLTDARQTTAAVTLVVDAILGNDSNPLRQAVITSGDQSALPFKDLPAAIAALPKNGLDEVNINVLPGNYTGVDVSGFNSVLGADGVFASTSFKINGSRGASVLASGVQTGMFTSGSGKTATLTGAGWTDDDLQRRFVRVTAGTGAGKILAIKKNTGTVVTFATKANLDGTSQFEIEDVTSIINTASPIGACFLVQGHNGSIRMSDMKFDIASTFSAFAIAVTGIFDLTRIVSVGPIVGLSAQQVGIFNVSECYSEGALTQAFNCTKSFSAVIAGVVAKDSSGAPCGVRCAAVNDVSLNGVSTLGPFDKALEMAGCSLVSVGTSDVDGADVGAEFDSCNKVDVTGGLDISNSLSETIALIGSKLIADAALTGTNNAGFGVRCHDPGSLVELLGLPTIAGAAGDASIDGVAALSWAVDFALANDFAVNAATGSRIVRTA